MTDYALLTRQLRALIGDETNRIANLANASSLIYHELPDVNWVGFYLLDGDELVLGPFQGKSACVRIALGDGVCGSAALSDRLLRVADVHAFPGHIACDAASNSEIVVPLHTKGRVAGVLDIDSPVTDRFDQADEDGIAELAATIESVVFDA